MIAQRPSIHVIAKRANVSAVTVSRILNGKVRGARPKSALRIAEIHRIADEIGYRPHMAARSMASGRFSSVGLIRGRDDGTSNDFGGHLTWQMEQTFSRRGITVLIGTMDDSQLDDVAYVPRLLRELSSDGLVINYTHNLPPHLLAIIEDHKLPVVWPNSNRPYNSVYPDDFNGARRATELLLRLGHTRIAFASAKPNPLQDPHYSKADRRNGYQAAMANADLAPEFFDMPDYWRGAILPTCDWLSQPQRPTAIVGYGFFEANTMIMAAARLGLQVPRDLSIVGMCSSFERAVTGLPLTMLEIPVVAMGEAAAEMLLERIAHPGTPLPSRVLPFSLAEGDTTAPPPGVKNIPQAGEPVAPLPPQRDILPTPG